MAFYWCGIFTIDQLITEGERPYFTDSRTIKVKWSLLPSMFNNIVGLLEPRFRLVSVALWWDIWMACYYFCYCWWWWMSSQPRTAKDCKKQVRSSRCSFSKFWKFQRSSLEDKWFIWCSNIRMRSEKLIQVGPFSLFSLGRAVSKSLGWTCGFLQTAPSSLRRLMFWNRGVKQIRCKCPVMSTPGSDAEALMLLWCQKN